ncbi:MAG: hypothetical protein IKL59_07925 [Clostridia bacterium]|nr:hypothetical protein [Clostridia bacterium]
MPMLKTKRIKPRRVIFNAMFAIALLVIIIYVSFSWFVSSKQAEVSGITMNVDKGTELMIKTENSEDGKSLELDFDDEHPLQSLAGNGQYLYSADIGFDPLETDTDNENTVFSKKILGYLPIESLETVGDYIEAGAFACDFSLNINKDTDVYLYGLGESGEGSSVTPAPIDHYADEKNTGPYGDFDIGNIAGAIRVAFLQKNDAGQYVPTLIWAPNTSTEFGIDDNNQYFVKTDSDNYEEKYTVIGNSKDQIFEINTGSSAQGANSDVLNGTVYAWGDLSEKQKFGTLSANKYGEFRLVVWVDGNDRECHNALLGGLICVNLKIGT